VTSNPALLTAFELLNMKLPEPSWAIPELLPTGLTILGGRPKVGKSWLALQIAQAIGAGGMMFGKKVKQGRVLYLALEDSPRRLQGRMIKMQWKNDQGIQVDFIVLSDFIKLIGAFHHNGATTLRDQYIKAIGYKLVVIDTLSRAFPGIKDIDNNQDVTKALAPIQEIGQETDCAILVVDHHNKGAEIGTPNPINDILGSTAKAAVLDTAWGLYREKGKPTFNLMITGREVEEQTLTLKRDYLTMAWQVDNQTVSNNPFQLTLMQQKIIDFLNDYGRSGFSNIVKTGRFDKGNCWRALQDLMVLGEVNHDKGTNEYYI